MDVIYLRRSPVEDMR